jgi:hypothetical protein
MIAQMQGKFQNIFIPGGGHVVHEDFPGQTANLIVESLGGEYLRVPNGGSGGRDLFLDDASFL